MYSTPLESQKMVAITFPTENVVFAFLGFHILLFSTDSAAFLNYEQIIIHICPPLVFPNLTSRGTSRAKALKVFCSSDTSLLAVTRHIIKLNCITFNFVLE